MPKMPIQKVGRVAFREEGDNWCAYYAQTDTMEGALPLGSIRMGIAMIPERKAEFMQLMRSAVADMFESTMGVRPTFPDPPEAAPEHEKSGRA